MTDRLFADCCYGTEGQHADWQPCPRKPWDELTAAERRVRFGFHEPQSYEDMVVAQYAEGGPMTKAAARDARRILRQREA